MTEQTESIVDPHFLFFRDLPEVLHERAPLASSLQSFETTLMLISVWRYPAALITCFNAIEGALKAHPTRSSPEKKLSFWKLEKLIREESPSYTDIEQIDIDRLRKTRNAFAHFGFSPKDDRESAELLLGVGLPFLRDCYRSFFDFELMGSNGQYGGLIQHIDTQLTVALNTFGKSKKHCISNLSYCLNTVGHVIRWGLRENFLSPLQIDLLDTEEQSGRWNFEMVEKLSDRFEKGATDGFWKIDCPICPGNGSQTLCCDLDLDAMSRRKIKVLTATCVWCGVSIGPDEEFLGEEFCGHEFTSKVIDEIIEEYGL